MNEESTVPTAFEEYLTEEPVAEDEPGTEEEETADDAGYSEETEEDEELDLGETPSDDEDGDEEFAIDPDLAEKLDEKNRKRLENHLKGAAKVKKQAEALRADAELLARYNEALSNPETAGLTLKRLAQGIAEQFGTSVETLLGLSYEETDWKEEAKREIVDPAVQALRKEIAELKAMEQKRAEQAMQENYLKQAYPKVKGLVHQRWPGLTATKEEIIEAVSRFPELRNNPFKAWVKTQGEKIASYKPSSKKAREMASDSSSAERVKPLSEMRFSDYLK